MDIVREWFKYAANDLRIAAHIFENMQPRPAENVCYHCQQAAEKALKGFLISTGTEPPKIHDLERLCGLCAEHDTSFEPMSDMCRELTDYAASARYPGSMDIEEEDAVSALSQAQTLYDFCAGMIPGLKQSQDRDEEQVQKQTMQ
jgi:HEPN domain-containing protein